MNICILTFDYPPHAVYGSGVYVDFLKKLLRQAGCDVEIITVNRFGLLQDDDAIFCKCMHESEAIASGKCVCTFGSMDCLNGLLEKTIKRFGDKGFIPDVIYVNGYMFFDLASKLKAIYHNAKLISAIHFLVEQDNAPENHPERQRIFDEETRMLAFSDEIIYFGHLAYDLAEKRHCCNMTKFNFIPHAFNVPIHTRTFKGTHRLVYASRLEPKKGITYLCRALADIEEFTFDIIGTGRLYRLINATYGNTFSVYGYKNKEFVIEQLKNADFFILPSFSEQCPVIVLEGMACGCIPIISDFGDLSELLKKHSSGIVFDIEREDECMISNISDAVQYALQMDHQSANRMIETNYGLLQQYYSPEVMLNRTIEVFSR